MKKTLLVCCGTGCIANGSLKVAAALREAIAAQNSDAVVETLIKKTGCNGFCENGPIVKVLPDDISYYRVRVKDAGEIIDSLAKTPVERLLYRDDAGTCVQSQRENPFYKKQQKLVLKNIGEIDPLAIDDYLARAGYEALKKALTLPPDEIIAEVEKSGLRGRGGAGFPTGKKWRTAASYASCPKYVVMNGDEGDPGAFMDRSLLEGDPHSILEGIAICALAIGAEEGFLYIRNEYSLALKNVKKALSDAVNAGILGGSILGSGKSLRLNVVRGGGAFVCGESTALMASIEGGVGEPRAKYIRSVEHGLWNQPTVLNNVETFANIPQIILQGGEKFAAIGTEKSKGTKVFALVGKIRRSGLVEVPMGTTLREIIFEIGGGIPGNRAFKAVQTGGPSGGCLPEALLDVPVDFDTLLDYGSMMGSGGMIVMDDRTCMVEVARYYVSFLANESCGKCTPCRECLKSLVKILTRISEGQGAEGDLAAIENLCEILAETALCGLGKSAANPVITTMKYFAAEYAEHIREKRCRAGVCGMGAGK
ncbi:MAG: SLBB domain-containing protein [Sporomusaceae bacterium]|jgi:NADH-quinone oxidoreductase subunit F|nr:SLBB domain-containing protein [Sporomusaceae bacterium]